MLVHLGNKLMHRKPQDLCIIIRFIEEPSIIFRIMINSQRESKTE